MTSYLALIIGTIVSWQMFGIGGSILWVCTIVVLYIPAPDEDS